MLSILEIIALYFLSALLLAILAVIYSDVLTQPGEIFAPLFRRLSKAFRNDLREQRGDYPHPIFKALIGCPKCVSGQIAFWSYLVIMMPAYFKYKVLTIAISHLCFISLTIFFAILIQKLLNDGNNTDN